MLSKISVKRPVTTLMVILIFIAFGVMSLLNMQMDSMPNMNIPMAMVLTRWNGAGPEEVMENVTKPIENAIGTVSGLKEMTSSSNAGTSMVMLEFNDGTDINSAVQEVNEKLNSMFPGSLPDDADSPSVLKMDMNASSIMTISVSSDVKSQVELKSFVDDKLAERLERVAGVASMDIFGGMEQEIHVEVIEYAAAGYGVTFADISNLLSRENNDYAGGNLQKGTLSLNTKTKGKLNSISEIQNLVLTTQSGAKILLRDVADVSQEYSEMTNYSYMNGSPNIAIRVTKQSTANTVSVSNALLEEIESLCAEFPEITFDVTSDSADDVRALINAVFESAWQGMVLAVLVLYLFLRNIRSTVVVALAMPISIISIFSFMYFAGLSLNTMSLSGLVLGVGMLVDNSIVVLESVFRRMEEGESRMDAAINGAKEVAMSITASTLTTVVVFLPIVYIGGMIGQYFNDLAFTIAFSLFASLIVALTFVPMCCALILKPEAKSVSKLTGKISAAINGGIVAIETAYKKALGFVLRHRVKSVLVSIAFFCITMLSLLGLGKEFMTFGTAGVINLTLTPSDNITLDEAVKIADSASSLLDENIGELIKTNSLQVQQDSVAFEITLIDEKLRDKDDAAVTQEVRGLMSQIAGVDVSTEPRMMGGGAGGSGGLTVEVYGNDTEALSEIGDDLVKLFNGIDGIVEASSSMSGGGRETIVTVNREKASYYGVSSYEIGNLIYQVINGSKATSISFEGTDTDVIVRYPEDKLKHTADLNDLSVQIGGGKTVPLSEFATFLEDTAATSMNRKNQQTYVSISAQLEGIDSGTAMQQVSNAMNTEYVLPANYSWSYGGSQLNMQEAFAGLARALLLSLFLVYAVMAAEFESLYYPFIIMFSIPIALSGGLFGLKITGSTLSITAYLGLITLAGVVINNAIVLVDYVNILRRERNMELTEALTTAGPVRLRAILMSTITTVLGLVPMALGMAKGIETMQSLAITVVFGLTLGTLVTLLLIPALYSLFEGGRVRMKALLGRRKQTVQPEHAS